LFGRQICGSFNLLAKETSRSSNEEVESGSEFFSFGSLVREQHVILCSFCFRTSFVLCFCSFFLCFVFSFLKCGRNFLIVGSGVLYSYWLSFSGVAFDCRFCLIYCLTHVSDLPGFRRCLLRKTETMLPQKQAEEAIVSNFSETEHEGKEQEKEEDHSMFSVKTFLWHGGSAWDAWFSCASNQVNSLICRSA
jgi:hypothetical protein